MQWEFQVGPSVGIASGDELWAARYILEVLRKFVDIWERSEICLFFFGVFEIECRS